MSSASLRLAEPVVFLVGGLDYERARQRQRRAAARAANQAANQEHGVSLPSRGPSRPPSPDRGTSGTRAASLSRPVSRAPSRGPSAPGSRTASPAPRGRLSQFAEDFIPPNSRGRSHSRTRHAPPPAAVPTPSSSTAPATPTSAQSATAPIPEGLNRGRSNSLVREMTEAQLRLQQEQEHAALDEPPPAMLRGILSVHLSKPTRIKEITIRLKGVARTDWPEGE